VWFAHVGSVAAVVMGWIALRWSEEIMVVCCCSLLIGDRNRDFAVVGPWGQIGW